MKKFEVWVFSIVASISVIGACFAIAERDWFKLLSECATLTVFAGVALVSYKKGETTKLAMGFFVAGFILGIIRGVLDISRGAYNGLFGCVLLVVLSGICLWNIQWFNWSGKDEEEK
ncbi:hypothetical protein [Bacillus cereus]|uniref:hypothetical protein n=1 Tax=Bacillus cereus TaxID=1396 RepID=UPI000BFE0D40|nr:hypothetical protein [Bacillus cereus]PGR83588.1 hypothetical protein COC63_06275 [Bacillus cereus]